MPGPTAPASWWCEEWGDFFDDYLGGAAAPPADAARRHRPVSAHAAPDVRVAGPPRAGPLARARRSRRGRCPSGRARPTTCSAPDGTRYVSFADWICPTHCIEPAICPGDPGAREPGRCRRPWRAWPDGSAGLIRPPGPVLFVCGHRVFGVGMFDVTAVLAGDAAGGRAGAGRTPVDVLVGTISSCHGAASLLHLGLASRAERGLLRRRHPRLGPSLARDDGLDVGNPWTVLYLTQPTRGTG